MTCALCRAPMREEIGELIYAQSWNQVHWSPNEMPTPILWENADEEIREAFRRIADAVLDRLPALKEHEG